MPVVKSAVPGTYTIVGARAFVAGFTRTLAARTATSLTLDATSGARLRVELVPPGGGTPVNLVTASSLGVFTGSYRIRVTRTAPTARTRRLTFSIANNGDLPATDGWELRATHPDAPTWQIRFDDPSVDFVACEPVAAVAGPPSGQEAGPVELVAADARGPADAPTVLGTLPDRWRPCYSWTSDGPVDLGLPRCDTSPAITVAVPDIPAAQSVRLTVRATYGGVCPDNTSYLQSTSPPAELALGAFPPPALFTVSPDRVEAGGTVDVTVTGTNLLPGPVFEIPGVGVTVLGAAPDTARLRLTIDPAVPAGPHDLRVRTLGGTDVRPGVLTVLSFARITGLSPSTVTQRSIDSSVDIAITGDGLETAQSVTVRGDALPVRAVTPGRVDVALNLIGSPRPAPGRPFTVWIADPETLPMPVTVKLTDGRVLSRQGTFVALGWRAKD